MLRIYGDLHARLRLALALLQVSALWEGHFVRIAEFEALREGATT